MLTVFTVMFFNPKTIEDWKGTASELAGMLKRVAPLYGLPSDEMPSERLLRYYVTERILTRPIKTGRESQFGYRQIIECLVIRVLLRDKWHLERIADAITKSSDDDLLNWLREKKGQSSPQEITEEESQSSLPEVQNREYPSEVLQERISEDNVHGEETMAQRLVREYSARYERPKKGDTVTKATPATTEMIASPEQVRERAQRRILREEFEQEVRLAFERLGTKPDLQILPPRKQEIRFSIASWCELSIRSSEFQKAFREAIIKTGDEQVAEKEITEAILLIVRKVVETRFQRIRQSRENDPVEKRNIGES